MIDPAGGIAALLPPGGGTLPGGAGGAGGHGADAQSFAATLPQEQLPAQGAGLPGPAASAPVTPAPASNLHLATPPGTSVGDAILGTLQRFGQSVQGLNKLAATPSTPRLPGPASAALTAGSPAQGQPPGGVVGQSQPGQSKTDAAMHDIQSIWNDSMSYQAKMYNVAFNFGMVEASTESINKAIKTLLNPGG